jgi:hypothetical protein
VLLYVARLQNLTRFRALHTESVELAKWVPGSKVDYSFMQARRLEISGPCAAPYQQSSMGCVMDQVCRLLGYVPNAHRDLASITQNYNKLI